MRLGDLFKISESVGNGMKNIWKNCDLSTPLVGTPIDPKLSIFFKGYFGVLSNIAAIFENGTTRFVGLPREEAASQGKEKFRRWVIACFFYGGTRQTKI